jgi:hypothetical protein
MSSEMSIHELKSKLWARSIALILMISVSIVSIVSLFIYAFDLKDGFIFGFLNKTENVMLNLIAALVGAAISVYFLKDTVAEPQVKKLNPAVLQRKHIDDHRVAEWWIHSGVHARWIRNNLLPKLNSANNLKVEIYNININILNPTKIENIKLCAELYCRLRSTSNVDAQIVFHMQNIISTVVASAIYNKTNKKFRILVRLKNEYDPFRYDMTNLGLFITQPDAKKGGYYADKDELFYQSMRINFEENKKLKHLELISDFEPLINNVLNRAFFSDILTKNELSIFDTDETFKAVRKMWRDVSDVDTWFSLN